MVAQFGGDELAELGGGFVLRGPLGEEEGGVGGEEEEIAVEFGVVLCVLALF